MEAVCPIQPELLASKIEKIQNFEYPELLDQFSEEPQLVRVLWFLQFISQPANYAGGLSRFAADFVAQCPNVGTAAMLQAKPISGRYSLADAVEIFRDLPSEYRCHLFGGDFWHVENEFLPAQDYWDDSVPDKGSRTRRSRAQCSAILRDRLTEQTVRDICTQAAKEHLGQYFKRLCELPHVSFRAPCAIQCRSGTNPVYPEGAPWYFAGVADALVAFMAKRADAIKSRIADTEVTQLVTRWILKSRNTKESVMIIGNSRFGKSEAVKMNADIEPGSCRLVETPDSTAIGDLLREVARTLGLEVGAHNSVRELRELIEYVLRFSGLQLIVDEAQMLLPGTFSRNTTPARLNWVRRSMMDRKIPVVFVCTPQSYLPAKKRFVNATGFAMEQFDERILKTVELPKELSESDLLAVAKIHFPNQRAEYLQYVVDQVILTERNFVSDIGKIALLAKDNAGEAGRKTPNLADVDSAMADVLPTVRSTPRAMAGAAAAEPKHRPCNGSAMKLRPARRVPEPLPIPSRDTPVMIDA
jgi:hypothetical protein